MKLTMIRHAKVNMTYESAYASADYDRAQAAYDAAPIMKVAPDKAAPACDISACRFLVSPLSRTHETLFSLYGDVPYTETKLLREVPLVAFADTTRVLPRFLYRALGRTQWFLNIRRQPEVRRDTLRRAQTLLRHLEQQNADCILVTHEFFLYTWMFVLKRNGYTLRRPEKKGIRIRNLERIYAEK